MEQERKKVLIVDNEEDIRFALRKALEGKYDIVGEAVTGNHAIEIYKKQNPEDKPCLKTRQLYSLIVAL